MDDKEWAISVSVWQWALSAMAIAAVLLAYAYTAYQAGKTSAAILRTIRETPIEFTPAEEWDPEAPKDPRRARITKANFVRYSPMRRVVRNYDLQEDGADPFRGKSGE